MFTPAATEIIKASLPLGFCSNQGVKHGLWRNLSEVGNTKPRQSQWRPAPRHNTHHNTHCVCTTFFRIPKKKCSDRVVSFFFPKLRFFGYFFTPSRPWQRNDEVGEECTQTAPHRSSMLVAFPGARGASFPFSLFLPSRTCRGGQVVQKRRKIVTPKNESYIWSFWPQFVAVRQALPVVLYPAAHSRYRSTTEVLYSHRVGRFWRTWRKETAGCLTDIRRDVAEHSPV